MNWTKPWLGWVLAWLLAAGLGAGWLAQQRLQTLHEAFTTNARVAHRLLSQQMVQHDAILGTLALLQPPLSSDARANAASSGLSRLYPQILGIAQHRADQPWPTSWPAALYTLEKQSAASGHAHMDASQLAQGKLFVVQAGQPSSYALQLDLPATVPLDEWPYPAQRSPVRIWLSLGDTPFVLHEGAPDANAPGWAWSLSKTLASPSQMLDLHERYKLHASLLPWWAMLGWALLCALVLAGLRAAWQQRAARLRAEQLLQHGHVARLNTLGELAAGMAHELNQPLTAILSNSQAARRLLDDAEPDVPAARRAMEQAAEQAKRASGVVGRLRRLVERPGAIAHPQTLALQQVVNDALHLLEPELRQRQIQVQQSVPAPLPPMQIDPVALQQILHNLLVNAMQAMDALPPAERSIAISQAQQGAWVQLRVQDNGPGIAPEMRDRLFTPFATTRAQGLGLGLTLSESLAESMGGQLRLVDSPALRGACFELALPAPSAKTPGSTTAPAATASPATHVQS